VTLDPTVQTILRIAVSLLLLAAARHKLADFAHFCGVVQRYRLLPTALAKTAAALLVAIEGAVGVALWVPALAVPAALAAFGLLSLYSTAIGINLVRGRRHIDCGCGRSGRDRPLSGALLIRNAGLGLAALASMLPVDPRAPVWIDGVTVVAGVAVLALLYAAVDASLYPARWAARGAS
jgi:hypothetical protein